MDTHAMQELKATVYDQALAAMVSSDAAGRIVAFNCTAEQVFGYSAELVLGQRVSELLIPVRLRARHEAGLAHVMAGKSPPVLGRRIQSTGLRADGTEFPIEISLWRTEVDGASYFTAAIVDLTEAARAQQEMERQREALRQGEKLIAMGSLLAGVAHELNNPLAIAMGRASLLEDKCEGSLKRDARRIREAAERCGRIVRTFTDMARGRPAQRRWVDLNDIVRAAADVLHYTFRTRNIELVLALGAVPARLLADPDQLGQVLLSLLTNVQAALEDAPLPRRVEVRTWSVAACPGGSSALQLRVSDNRPAVAPALRASMFEPVLSPVDAGSPRVTLGLAVSRSLVRAHGGELRLDEQPETGGVAFVLDFPLAANDEPAMRPTPLAVPATRRPRVLVVDDEPEVGALIRDTLLGHGYAVEGAASAQAALRLLASRSFDALVSDVRMPDMDGRMFWQEVKARFPHLARRLMFVTGDTLSRGTAEFLEQTGCTTLEKPFAETALIEGVDGLLRA